MSFVTEDNIVLVKYNEVWNKTKRTLSIEFRSEPVYDEKYIKTKVTAFNEVINTIFTANKIPKESIHYICIAAINIESIMRIDKKTILKFILKNVNIK